MKKNKAALEYYHANKGKIRERERKKRVAVREKQCKQKGLPAKLADFITFRTDGKIVLTFATESELRKFLVQVKTTYEFDEDFLKDVR